MSTISKLKLTLTGLGPYDPSTGNNLPITDGFAVYFFDVVGDLDNSQVTRSKAQPTQLTYRTDGVNTVTLEMTDLVERSYNSGDISKLIASGHLTDTVQGAVNAVEGTELFNRNQHNGGDENGDENDQGIRISGKSGVNNGFVDLFFDDSRSALAIVAHAPTNQEFAPGEPDADDADLYIYTSEGYKLVGDEDSDVGSGGELRVYTGKGYDSNNIDNEGSKGGSVHFNTGDGGEFGGEGGDFDVSLGTGHGERGGEVSLYAGHSDFESDGGSVILRSGRGNGVGNFSGDIVLEILDGEDGATEGSVRIPHLSDGLLSVQDESLTSTGNGFVSGKATVNVPVGQLITATIADASFVNVLRQESVIIVTLQTVAGVTVATAPFITAIINDTDFTVGFDVANGNGGAVDIVLNYMIVG